MGLRNASEGAWLAYIHAAEGLQRRSKVSLEEGEAKSTTPQMEEVMALRASRLAASPNTPETSEEEAEGLGVESEAMEVTEEVKVVRFASNQEEKEKTSKDAEIISLQFERQLF